MSVVIERGPSLSQFLGSPVGVWAAGVAAEQHSFLLHGPPLGRSTCRNGAKFLYLQLLRQIALSACLPMVLSPICQDVPGWEAWLELERNSRLIRSLEKEILGFNKKRRKKMMMRGWLSYTRFSLRGLELLLLLSREEVIRQKDPFEEVIGEAADKELYSLGYESSDSLADRREAFPYPFQPATLKKLFQPEMYMLV